MRPSIIGIVAFALMAGSLVAAETYKFELPGKVQAGQTQLKPGTYSIVVDGTDAVLKDKSGKTIDVKGKVEPTTKKASATSFGMSGEPRILGSVTIGGTRLRVVFE